ELMRRFGGSRIAGLMDRLGLEEDVPLEHGMVTKAIEGAQEKVEAYNFDIRKHVVEYDDVMNRQREVLYDQRRQVLGDASSGELIMSWVEDEVRALVGTNLAGEHSAEWDWENLFKEISAIYPLPQEINIAAAGPEPTHEEVVTRLLELAGDARRAREEKFGADLMRSIERFWLLRMIDQHWIQHLTAIDDLREGIGLRAYGQRDPLVEYKREAHEMWEELLSNIHEDVVRTIFHIVPRTEPVREQPRQIMTNRDGEEDGTGRKPVKAGAKVGRNDTCPCGSGKKYKRCHGR
ncbi:MAG: SEC-C domain-containing protein, partial [Chloroflexi bacterium]|nr:SEC-C domain-containing protein [Chloroflexota bacterium]